MNLYRKLFLSVATLLFSLNAFSQGTQVVSGHPIYNLNDNIGIDTNNPLVKLQVNGSMETYGATILKYSNLAPSDFVTSNTYRTFLASAHTNGSSTHIGNYFHYRSAHGGYINYNSNGYGFYSQGAYPRMFMEVISGNHGNFDNLPSDSPVRSGYIYQQIKGPTGPAISSPIKATASNSTFLWGVKGNGDFIVDHNMGIGTATLTEKLNLNGNINMKGMNRRIYMGGVGASTYGIGFSETFPDYGIFYTEGSPDHVSISPNGNATNGVMNIYGNGRVGIGTTSPSYALDVTGSMGLSHGVFFSTANSFIFRHPAGSWTPIGSRGINIGDFTNTPTYGQITTGSYHLNLIVQGQTRMLIDKNNGNVGIGTTSPTNKLEVNGTIRSKKVKVDASGWPDYVFEPDYNLKPLSEVEAYIQTHKHLPEVPSAKEVEESGLDLGSLDAILLKKLEELTLYIIEKDKQVSSLEKENQELKKRLSKIETLIKHINSN